MNNIWKQHETQNDNTNRSRSYQISDGGCPLPSVTSWSCVMCPPCARDQKLLLDPWASSRWRGWLKGLPPAGNNSWILQVLTVSSLCVTSTISMLGHNAHEMGGGGGALGEHLGQEVQPHDKIRALINQDWESSLCPGPMWGEGGKDGLGRGCSPDTTPAPGSQTSQIPNLWEWVSIVWSAQSMYDVPAGAQANLHLFFFVKLNLPERGRRAEE